jgi:hypothetical protein
MAGEFEELALKVSLVDNATPQLKSIKSSLDELDTNEDNGSTMTRSLFGTLSKRTGRKASVSFALLVHF